MTLASRNAVVTGSTSGIGLAIARALAKEGANVTINGFGKAEDIDETGALVIQTADRGKQRVLAGDVEQVRRRPQTD